MEENYVNTEPWQILRSWLFCCSPVYKQNHSFRVEVSVSVKSKNIRVVVWDELAFVVVVILRQHESLTIQRDQTGSGKVIQLLKKKKIGHWKIIRNYTQCQNKLTRTAEKSYWDLWRVLHNVAFPAKQVIHVHYLRKKKKAAVLNVKIQEQPFGDSLFNSLDDLTEVICQIN